MQLVSRFDRLHPRSTVGVRVAVGIWLLIGAGIACSDGYWWGVVIVLPSALNFYIAYRTFKDR